MRRTFAFAVGILSALVLASVHAQAPPVVIKQAPNQLSTERVLIVADRVERSTSGDSELTMTGHVTLAAKGVSVLADRAEVQDGEYRLEGNVRLRVINAQGIVTERERTPDKFRLEQIIH
jgi:lipopolysaccharide assembly outer membrane protein LptD (OstA)